MEKRKDAGAQGRENPLVRLQRLAVDCGFFDGAVSTDGACAPGRGSVLLRVCSRALWREALDEMVSLCDEAAARARCLFTWLGFLEGRCNVSTYLELDFDLIKAC